MQATATETPAAPQAAVTTLDDQIRAIIPQIVPYFIEAGIMCSSNGRQSFNFTRTLTGEWVNIFLSANDQPAVKELVRFLEQTIGGKYTASAEVRSNSTRAYWRLGFQDQDCKTLYILYYRY